MFDKAPFSGGNYRQKRINGKKWMAIEPKKGFEALQEHAVENLKKDKTLKKTITYRVAVGILGAGLVWVATGNIFATAGISVTTEVMRTAVYYAHEKAYEMNLIN